MLIGMLSTLPPISALNVLELNCGFTVLFPYQDLVDLLNEPRFVNFRTLKLVFRHLPCKHNLFHDAVHSSRWTLDYGVADKRVGF